MTLQASKVSQWLPLRCKNAPDRAKCFYDFSISATGIYLAVTDLCSVWDCSLQRETIVDSAREQNCSIDPADSTSQLRTLLNKLRQSLREGVNEIICDEAHDAANKDVALRVRTQLKLPAPLKMLRWTFHLPKRDSGSLAEMVTFPLLREAAVRTQQMEALFQVIKDKDHVLTKLLDKIDNSAIDLSVVFPVITGIKSRRQRVDVAEASKHVPGMAAFDRQSWQRGLDQDHAESSCASMNLGNILDGNEISHLKVIPFTTWPSEAFIEEKCPDSNENEHSDSSNDGEQNLLQPSETQAEVEIEYNDNTTESDFEDLENTPRRRMLTRGSGGDRQLSPSARRNQLKLPLLSSPAAADDETRSARLKPAASDSSDSESDRAPQRKIGARKTAARKLGMVGGKGKAGPEPQSSPTPPRYSNSSSPAPRLGEVGGREISQGHSSQAPLQLRTRSSTPETNQKGADSDTASSTSSAPSSHRWLPQPVIRETNPLQLETEPPEIEESVEEKAKRKREELKRTQVQAAGTMKKKARRF